MRVTRESLIRIAKENAQERAFNDHGLVAAYLTGSLVSDAEPMLGGTADIDLVFVHQQRPGITREIVKLTPDFHLDIVHRSKDDFKSPRELRIDPVLGYEMYDPMLLYQREKFFEFVQAGLRAGFEFHAPALVLTRCRKLLAEARKGWIDLSDIREEKAGPLQVRQFLRAIYLAANSIAELNGGLLAERRFLAEFPARAQAAERPDFTATLFNILGASFIDATLVSSWLANWETAFVTASGNAKVNQHVHPARLNYYKKAVEVFLAGETPLTSLWPLIHTWTMAAEVLENEQIKPWKSACEQLGLLGNGNAFEQRTSELDHYLDEIEVRFDEIAAANGLETSSGA
ncbi:MAG TPA: hypothetical protein VLX61_00155 [Anaerolineales bacterium]|nr:hypothetical protein [Anaerolineales bacterium]